MDETYGDDQGTSEVRNHCPVKSDESHPQTGGVAEEIVDNDIVWGDPAHPIEPRQGSEYVAGEPVPGEACGSGDNEETLAGHVLLVLQGVRLVQGVE